MLEARDGGSPIYRSSPHRQPRCNLTHYLDLHSHLSQLMNSRSSLTCQPSTTNPRHQTTCLHTSISHSPSPPSCQNIPVISPRQSLGVTPRNLELVESGSRTPQSSAYLVISSESGFNTHGQTSHLMSGGSFTVLSAHAMRS